MAATPGGAGAQASFGARTPGLPGFSGATPAMQASQRALGSTPNALGSRTPGMPRSCAFRFQLPHGCGCRSNIRSEILCQAWSMQDYMIERLQIPKAMHEYPPIFFSLFPLSGVTRPGGTPMGAASAWRPGTPGPPPGGTPMWAQGGTPGGARGEARAPARHDWRPATPGPEGLLLGTFCHPCRNIQKVLMSRGVEYGGSAGGATPFGMGRGATPGWHMGMQRIRGTCTRGSSPRTVCIGHLLNILM